MTTTPHSGTDGLTEDQRRTALDRFQILRPHLEEDVPLARTAHEHNLSLPHAEPLLAANLPPASGWRWLCRKSRTLAKDQRRMLPTLQQYIKWLVMLNLDQVIPAVVEVECEILVIGTE